MERRAQVRQRLGQAQVFIPVGFDRIRNFVQSFEGALFRFFHFGGIPFHFQRGKIQEQETEREQLPFPILANQPHDDLMDARAGRVRGVAEFHRKKHNIVALVSATNLHFRGDIRSLAAKNGVPGGIC